MATSIEGSQNKDQIIKPCLPIMKIWLKICEVNYEILWPEDDH